MDLKTYMSDLGDRSKKSRVYRDYQLTGLELANILDDQEHKSLYIKLAKTHDPSALIRLAKDICERRNVRNRGAYFMRMMKKSKEDGKNRITNK